MECTPFVSVVIPSHNCKDSLLRLLRSLSEQSYRKDNYEVIVVDDGSYDGTKEAIEIFQKEIDCNFRYFFQKNSGPSCARNFGIQNAKGAIIASLDADSIASKTWLEEITRGYEDKRVAGVGGMTKSIPASTLVSQYCAYRKMNGQPKADKTGIVYVITGNASFKKDYLNLIGGFDERFTLPGGEDPDLCYRLKQKGYIFKYNKNAVVFNSHKHTIRELRKTYYNYGIGDTFLKLRRYSKWDIRGMTGFKRGLHLMKIILRMIALFFVVLKVSLDFVKMPFSILSYYGNGLSIKRSISYSFLDYVLILSFIEGTWTGYWLGKFRGFRQEVSVG